MKYNIYRKRWTKPRGRRRVCEEQTGRYDCASVTGKSRHPGADDWAFAAQKMSVVLLDGGPGHWGDNERHWASCWPPETRGRLHGKFVWFTTSYRWERNKGVLGFVLNCHQNMRISPRHPAEKLRCLAWTSLQLCFFKEDPWKCLSSAAESILMVGRRFEHQDCALKPPARDTAWALFAYKILKMHHLVE